MATITPRRPQSLVEAHAHVRHPLQRVRGTIRTYVGLEGAALLLTLLACWFWVTFVLDFGPFRAVGWDWVQEMARPIRAFSLGWLFLCAVVLLRLGLIRRLFGEEASAILHTAFATSKKRQTLPVWMRLPVVGTVAPLLALGVSVLIALFGERAAAVSAYIAALGVLPLTAFLIPALHELYLVRSSLSRWVRAPVAGLGAAAGALIGATIATALTSDALTGASGGVATLIGAGLGAIVGDVLALVSIGIIAGLVRGEGYLVALAVPCVGVYLGLWVLAGLVASVSSVAAGACVVLLMAVPVLAVVAARLFRDFRDAALALVLERRFPEVLGDRLITAVELANPKKAAEYGYSEAMIEQTIHDAAERVQTVPVREVFDWKRLYRHWTGVAAVTLGLYLVFGGLFSIPFIGETGAGEHAGFAAFHQAAGLALERNVLLQNTIWPRRAFLEVLDWPEKGEKRIGKDDSAPAIKVRAYKWVVADSKAREGWRALAWHDLEKHKNYLGESAPAVNFREKDEHDQKDWGLPRDPAIGWTLDEIELRLGRDETHETLEPQTQRDLRDVLSKLETRAADPSMRRTLRMLIVPNQVGIRYRGDSGGGELTLQRQGDNEYTGQFPDLKESVNFTARGEDYQTPSYRITVVPPPALVDLEYLEERPAYMLYRARGDDPNALRGLKQRMPARPVSVIGGDTSRIDPVPAGSNIVLRAKADKPLRQVTLVAPPRVAPLVNEVRITDDPYTFEVRFDDLRATPERPFYDFNFHMIDTDGVVGQRHVIIKPHDDAAPDVSIDVKSLRKTPQGYMVTPIAYIPLEAKVIDDRGLHLIEYAASAAKLDRQVEQSGRGLFVLSALHLLPGGAGQEFAAASRIASLSREPKAGNKAAGETGTQRFPVPTFHPEPEEYPPLDLIKTTLATDKPLKVALKNTFTLLEKLEERDPRNKDTDLPYFFSLEQVLNPDGKPLKAGKDEIQPRYRVQVWMEAVDTDIETGKDVLKTAKGIEYRGNRGLSKEKLTFIVVAENELLSEIAKEEDALYVKLAEQVSRLQDSLAKLDRMKEDLTVKELKESQFIAMTARADELGQSLDRNESIVTEVTTDYQRILRELVANRVETSMIERVQKQIVEPLTIVVNGNEDDRNALDTFPKVRVGIAELHKAVTAEGNFDARVVDSRTKTDDARLRTAALIARLVDVLDKMQSLKDVNKLIEDLQKIEAEENRQKGAIKTIIDQIIGDTFGDLK